MPRPRKITDADVRKYREPCQRKGCDGFVCTCGDMGGYHTKVCNDCGATQYYKGLRSVLKQEFEGARERALKKLRRSSDRRDLVSEGRTEDGTMATKLKATGKAVKKGSKKKSKKGKAAKKGSLAPREGTIGALVVEMLKKGTAVDKVLAAVKKQFPKSNTTAQNVRWYGWKFKVNAKRVKK